MTKMPDLMELLSKDERLHPDLKPWLLKLRRGPLFLNHPLVQELSVDPSKAALINWRFEQKKIRVQEALDAKDLYRYVFLHERPYRLPAFHEFMRKVETDDQTYWEMVSSIWIDSENIWQNRAEWGRLWSSPRPGKYQFVMDDDERARFDQLPDIVEVYRGINNKKHVKLGLSWTLSRAKAEWFAKRYAGLDESLNLVLTGQIARKDIHAVILGRGEQEVVCQKVKRKIPR